MSLSNAPVNENDVKEEGRPREDDASQCGHFHKSPKAKMKLGESQEDEEDSATGKANQRES